VFFKGSLEKFKASGIGRQPTWIPRFVILKESQIECYSDEIVASFPLLSFFPCPHPS